MDLTTMNSLKNTLDFDLTLYISAMIKANVFDNTQILEAGAFVGAHYTFLLEKKNIEVTEQVKENIIMHVCKFYSEFLTNNIGSSEYAIIKKRYYELLNIDPEIVEMLLQKLVNLNLAK